MYFFSYVFLCVLFIFLLNFYLKKKNFLINQTGDQHQIFASKKKIPLTGGIFIFLGSLYFYKNFLGIYFLFSLVILIIGILSDLKIIKSASKRFVIQITITLMFIFFSDIQLYNTKIHILDNLLSNNSFNIFFVTFCILIVINGSNFLDGLNTLNIGYYFIISLIIFYSDNLQILQVFQFNGVNIILLLSIVFILNLFNKIYLGDSGSYLIGFIFSISLIYLYNFNQNISPFFIVLLLWYPSFETLFSILRKNILNKSPLHPDSLHLHHHIFFMLKNKFKMQTLTSNICSALLINMYNFLIFSLAINFLSNSQIQILIIILNVFLYLFIYFKLNIFRYKKL